MRSDSQTASGNWPIITDPLSQELPHRQMTAGSVIETPSREGARSIMIGDKQSRLTSTAQATTRENEPGMMIVEEISIATATTTAATSGIEEVSPHVANDAMIYTNDVPY